MYVLVCLVIPHGIVNIGVQMYIAVTVSVHMYVRMYVRCWLVFGYTLYTGSRDA